MNFDDSHPSDRQFLLAVEGKLSSNEEREIGLHLDACWKCRARRQEIENAIADFTRAHQELDSKFPPAAEPRALLKAQLAQISAQAPRSNWFGHARRFDLAVAAAACAFAVLGMLFFQALTSRQGRSLPQPVSFSIPNPRLTPGAAILSSRQAVCSLSNTKNKAVSLVLQKQVFEEYGIPSAEPRAYEIDYLITPALGGADDIRNLWPHSYSATAWNAAVKDELEDRLREMVCDGSVDLTEAQNEIAQNWIAAYKKYFHTEQPIEPHGK